MNRRQLLRHVSIALGVALSPSLARAMRSGVDNRNSILTSRLSDQQRAMCRTLAELIIPATDTPGAIAAGVPNFIELMVSDWYTKTERAIFLHGLNQIDEFCLDQFSAAFLQCSSAAQGKALDHMESAAADYQGQTAVMPLVPVIDENQPFFTKLKELTVLGYYTSEVGSKQELVYLPMPMEYRDIDFNVVDRQWSS